MEWLVDDCYDEDDDGCEAPYDFHLPYEIDNGYYYYEDNFNETDIWLNQTTIIPEGVAN